MQIPLVKRKDMFEEKEETDFWNTLFEMILENTGGDVQWSDGRYTDGMSNSAPSVVTVNQRDELSAVVKINKRKMNQTPHSQCSYQKSGAKCVE